MIEFLTDGGPFMIFLVACAVLAVAVIIERWLVLREVKSYVGPFLEKFNNLIKGGKLQEARTLCEDTPHPVSRMLKAGLDRHDEVREGQDMAFIHDQIDKAVSEAGTHAVDVLEKRLNLLAIISNLGPLLGFTGTVTGMIVAFASIAAAENVDVSGVASGLSQALNTTASGLVIGITATVGHSYFAGKIEEFVGDLEEASNRMLAHIIRDIIRTRHTEAAD